MNIACHSLQGTPFALRALQWTLYREDSVSRLFIALAAVAAMPAGG